MKNHFELMSEYNRMMNEQVYSSAATLNPDVYTKDIGLFFHSVHGTLNHIIVGDLIWLRRFNSNENQFPELNGLDKFSIPKSLNEILFEDLSSLQEARVKLDKIIKYWISNDLIEHDFGTLIEYTNTQGIHNSRNFGELLHHLFNHQTHHRGQVSAALNQLSIDIGVTDFFAVIPNEA